MSDSKYPHEELDANEFVSLCWCVGMTADEACLRAIEHGFARGSDLERMRLFFIDRDYVLQVIAS